MDKYPILKLRPAVHLPSKSTHKEVVLINVLGHNKVVMGYAKKGKKVEVEAVSS